MTMKKKHYHPWEPIERPGRPVGRLSQLGKYYRRMQRYYASLRRPCPTTNTN